MLLLKRNPYPLHYRAAFACSLLLYPPPHRLLLRAAFRGRRQPREMRAYQVAPLSPCGLGRASPPVGSFSIERPDQLPGWRQLSDRQKNRDAGPVNFIGWFGLSI
jgi:hypothetical protein